MFILYNQNDVFQGGINVCASKLNSKTIEDVLKLDSVQLTSVSTFLPLDRRTPFEQKLYTA